MNSFPLEETSFLFSGPAGNLEVMAAGNENASASAIICHPHSLHGGTMNNKVVTMLARALQELGLRTVRFNFRGVGKSEGSFDGGKGETEDVLAIAQWIKQLYPQDALWLAGFSFGSYVTARATMHLSIKQLISIAPPVTHFDFGNFSSITCPWLIIQGDQDEIVPPQAVYDWAKALSSKPVLIRLPDAGHFFHGQLMALKKIIRENLNFSR